MTRKEAIVRKAFIESRTLAKSKTDLSKLKKGQREPMSIILRHGPAELLKRLLQGVGTFYRTTEGALLFFRDGDHKLYDIEERTFERYLIQLTDSVTGVQRQWLPRLQAWVRFEALEVKTHFLAYSDGPDLNMIAINMFDGRMIRRKHGGTWEEVPNGTDGILFLTPTEFLTPWKADFKKGGTGKDLEWLCSLGHFSDDGPLSIDDQRKLLRVWLLHLFLPEINPVHPIPLHEGVTGSGKSVMGEAIGRWLTGPEFEVMDLPSGDAARAEESIKLALCKRPLVVIDNMDSPAPWLEDFLCRVATGVRMSRRRHYTNAEEVFFTPRAGLIVTSRDPHFRREDVARRLLPIRFGLIPEEQRRSETDIRAELDARRAAIWADILVELARGQDAWPSLKGTLKPSHSLADFSVFGALLTAAQAGNGALAEWTTLMQRLELAQGRFTTEEDPLADFLRAVLPSSGVLSQRPMRELFTSLRDQASESGLPWPYKNVGALTKAVKNKRTALERALNARISLTNTHQGGEYRVEITRLSPGDGGADASGGEGGEGGDDSATPLSATEGLPPEADKKAGNWTTMPTLPTPGVEGGVAGLRKPGVSSKTAQKVGSRMTPQPLKP